MMLGLYKNFPKTVHKIVDFSTSISTKRLQEALVETFHKLNHGTFSLEEVSTPSTPQCAVIFEFGVAEDNDFSYLDEEEKKKLLRTIDKRPLATMDLLCVIRYYKVQEEKKKALKFDYYMLRFTFIERSVEMQIFHERGLMYVTPKDLPPFLVGKINAEFAKKALRVIEVY